MNNILQNAFVGGAFLAAAVMGMPALAANGNLVQVTIQTEMNVPGMGSMPAQTTTRKVCMGTGRFTAEQLLKSEPKNNCKITNYKIAGNVVTFDSVCRGATTVTTHGEFHLSGAANFTGKIHGEINAEGHAATMDATYTGVRVGTCDYTPPKG